MKEIVIYGAGGLSKDVLDIIEAINSHSYSFIIRGFYDDGFAQGAEFGGYPVLGGIEQLIRLSDPINVVFAIGNSLIVKGICERLKANPLIQFPNLVHPSCVNSLVNVKLGQGNVVNASAVFGRDVCLGDFNLLNSRVLIGHDTVIGSYNHFSPSVSVAGSVVIEDLCFFGLNSSVLQGIKVPPKVRLGAQSLLIRKPKSGNTYFGVPAIKQ